MREMIATAKTVEEAVDAACRDLGVDRNDLGVSYEVLEMPTRRLFKSTPARVKVTVSEPEPAKAAPAQKEAPAAPQTPAARPAPQEDSTKPAPAVENKAPAAAEPAEPTEPAEEALDIAADPRLQAAVEYLTPIFTLMGASNFTFTAAKKGEATILHVEGSHLGGLIGRRGETMESLSYLASLVVNRMEGPYVKLGIDVGGYRTKREDDLAALARRMADRVIRTGCCYEMEPMNPYERHIIHTAVAAIDGVRSESKGEGSERRVVLYSTDPNASNLPDRQSGRSRNGRAGRSAPHSNGRSGRSARNDRRDGSRSGGRGPRNDRRGPRPSQVPAREFADVPRDPQARPQAPARTERIHDGDDFEMFGKIEL